MTDLSHDARALLDEARHEGGPTTEQRARMKRAVFGAVAASGTLLGGSGAAAGASTAKLTGLSLLAVKASTASLSAWFLAGTLGGVAVIAPVAAYRYLTTPPALTTNAHAPGTVAPVATMLAPTATQEPAPAPVAPAPDVAEPSAPPNSASAARRGAAPTSTREPQAPWVSDSPGLSAELALLGAAQRDLAAGRADQALSQLAEHGRRFPNGALAGERLAARVFALCALGRTEEARRAARDFQVAAPGSPLTPRVLASCGGTTPSETEP
jgi:hypothetical protein